MNVARTTAAEDTGAAIYQAIQAAHEETKGKEDQDSLARHLSEKLQELDCPTVTLADALAIAGQATLDCGSTDTGDPGWDGYEGIDEGVENHTLYHIGRPGECGSDCPALLHPELAGDDTD